MLGELAQALGPLAPVWIGLTVFVAGMLAFCVVLEVLAQTKR